MRALTWQGTMKVTVEDVADPLLIDDTDVIIRVTSTAICGSDLHLYDVLGPFLDKGDILGHEPMGVVEQVGSAVTRLAVGDRVVIPFVVACGHCFMCRQGLTTQCETTQNRATDTGASLYGYTELYGSVPGGQAELLRVPFADFNAQKVGTELPDERYLFLSDILPTAWQGVEYAELPEGGTLGVIGLGPVGQFVARIARHRGHRVIAVEPVAERRAMAERHGIETLDLTDDVVDRLRELTDGRGPDSIVDAVGMEAHGNPAASFAQYAVGLLPDAVAKKAMQTFGSDRLAALLLALDAVRRGGTVSLSGVYAGAGDPLPFMTMFDKGITLRMGQCNVHRWRDDILPLVEDPADPLGIDDLVTHTVSLEEAPEMYELFKNKQDGCIKVVLKPGLKVAV
ncbi:zinc-dependent alcohol dehydrogenase [Herbiconiux flava]|uniref:Threonine dehydrogenase-like Zn-dependent dehydrogenase n=1 Tax=Herbiconiux flava TaxID=881268 RepID=A0A852SMQ8_9MICO|nr:zinc-dependent alcohol dehydrogenase [Herbiconiux flava]NYD70095.1 threonine dehydrogenase-like Zn-dependent dehydrogenase [Herbiconiux flava]GLK16847.1 glutathione-dependent formaldehyde dehydrogenase [Herbiconiux flava]